MKQITRSKSSIFIQFELKNEKNHFYKKLPGVSPAFLSNFSPKWNKLQGVSQAFLSNLSSKMKKIIFTKNYQGQVQHFHQILAQNETNHKGVSPAFLSNFSPKWKKSQGVSPASLRIWAQNWKKSQRVSPTSLSIELKTEKITRG